MKGETNPELAKSFDQFAHDDDHPPTAGHAHGPFDEFIEPHYHRGAGVVVYTDFYPSDDKDYVPVYEDEN